MEWNLVFQGEWVRPPDPNEDDLTEKQYKRFVKRRNKFLEQEKIRLDKLRKKRYNKKLTKEK